ncbi:hypothetical protein SAMN05216350_11385 [Polaromonas sp. YR568]|nr:hypothetical protein SAMN05216350_11385 [Polaromonas sp. YR568]
MKRQGKHQETTRKVNGEVGGLERKGAEAAEIMIERETQLSHGTTGGARTAAYKGLIDSVNGEAFEADTLRKKNTWPIIKKEITMQARPVEGYKEYPRNKRS